MYGPGWVKCATCGVMQPLTSLVHNPKATTVHVKVGWHCKDALKCAEGKAHVDREKADFALSHPELHLNGVTK